MLTSTSRSGRKTEPEGQTCRFLGGGPLFSHRERPPQTQKAAGAASKPTKCPNCPTGNPSHTPETAVRSRSGQVLKKTKEPRTQDPLPPHARPGASRGSAGSKREEDRGRAPRQAHWPWPRDAGRPRPDATTEEERCRAARLTQWPQPREAGRPRPDTTTTIPPGRKEEGAGEESRPAKSRTRKTEEWGPDKRICR